MADSLNAAVICSGRNRAEIVSQNEIANGGGGGAEREFGFQTATGAAILNGSLDLNISADVNSLAHGIVTETTQWVWQVTANNNDGLTGYITASYQFNGLAIGDNKICSSPSSCIQVTNITAANTNYRRNGNNNNPNNLIRRVREGITFTMDLSGVQETGNYTGQLQIDLSIGDSANGTGNIDLSCDVLQ